MDELLVFIDKDDPNGKTDNCNSKRNFGTDVSCFQLVETINGLHELHGRLESLLESAQNPSVPASEILPTLAAFETATKALPAEIPDLVEHWAAKRFTLLARYNELVKTMAFLKGAENHPCLLGVMQPEKVAEEKMGHLLALPEEKEEANLKKPTVEVSFPEMSTTISSPSSKSAPLYNYCDQLEELFSGGSPALPKTSSSNATL